MEILIALAVFVAAVLVIRHLTKGDASAPADTGAGNGVGGPVGGDRGDVKEK